MKKTNNIQKENTKKTSNPTDSLDANIAILCEGLRIKGFNRYADEIENKFFALKTAEAKLYGVRKGDAEDLINAAHPDGSVKIKGVAGDATVETIIDQKKIIEDILKKIKR